MNLFKRLFGRTGAPADGDYAEPRLGLVFPMELGGLRRQSMGRAYAEGDRTGESIPYGGDQAQATVYVTTVGQATFPDGGDSEFIREELEGAVEAVREMERLGQYQSVKFFTAEPERLGTEPGNLTWARCAFFTVSAGRPTTSFTYITALRSTVIKLRLSARDPANEALQEFPRELGELVSRQRPRGVGPAPGDG